MSLPVVSFCSIVFAVLFIVYLFYFISGNPMRASNFGFKEQDVGNIDIIIETINELVSTKLSVNK